jgi:uncharacterized membrane protein
MTDKSCLATVVLTCFLSLSSAFPQNYTSVKFQYASLAFPGGTFTTANGINNHNVVVGSYFDRNFVVHGFIYREGKYTRVDVPGSTETEILGINDNGDMVGVYQVLGPINFHGFLRHNDHFTTIDDPQAQFGTRAFGVNTEGTVVGSFDDSQGFIRKNETFRTFNAPQKPGDPLQTQLNGINNQGWIVGQVLTGGRWRGFWFKGDDLDFLEPLGAADNEVTGINGRGDIVGCHDAASGFVSFRVEAFEGTEKTKKFPTRQKLVSCPSGINYSRVVVGNYFRVGQTNAFLAVPQLTLNVTGPADHSSMSNPVHLSATASGVNPIWQLQVWVNASKRLFVTGDRLDTTIELPSGSNERLVVKAVDSKGISTKVVIIVSVD